MTVPSATGEEPTRKPATPPWWTLAVLFSLSGVFVALYGYSVSSARLLFLELLIAIAGFSGGALIGFLFGLPKAGMPRTANAADDETAEPVAGERSGYLPSTNLEQVSDWLTKILIGVGLVELRDLGTALSGVGAGVAKAVGSGSGAAALTQVVLVAFAIVGFLASYLWTRLYYGEIQTSTDLAIINRLAARTEGLEHKAEGLEQKTEGLEQRVEAQTSVTQGLKKTANALARGEITPSGQLDAGPRPSAVPVGPAQLKEFARKWPPDTLQRLNALLQAPTDWDTDDVVEQFGERPSAADGRSLTGEIVSDLDKGLVIRLIVRRDGGRPLTGEVVFLLHSTFRDRAVVVPVRDDCAETTVYSEGWFTAGAVMDDGRTVLAYDLKNLPNVPPWFTEN